jgi:hypothetical protein
MERKQRRKLRKEGLRRESLRKERQRRERQRRKSQRRKSQIMRWRWRWKNLSRGKKIKEAQRRTECLIQSNF